MSNQIGLGYTGSALLGAGLTQITTDLKLGLALIGVGALLTITKAVLDHFGIEVVGRNR